MPMGQLPERRVTWIPGWNWGMAPRKQCRWRMVWSKRMLTRNQARTAYPWWFRMWPTAATNLAQLDVVAATAPEFNAGDLTSVWV